MPTTSKTTNKSRSKVTNFVQELERQFMLVLVCGETGVGKTYRNLIEIKRYLKGNPKTGRKGRKVLAFDVNDDDYPDFKTVRIDLLQRLKAIRARRIRPLTKEGRTMTIEEKRDTVQEMVNRFKNGLLVLEDLDKYMVGAKGQSIVGLLTTNRHNALDIMISHQSIAKVTTTEWQNCTWLRLHHQVDDISRYANRIPNYFLVRIANFIVDEQYDLANNRYAEGKIETEEYKKRRSFYLYVDMRRLRLRGVSKKAFVRACKRFIDLYENSKVKRLLQERDLQDRPRFKNRAQVIIHLITQYLRHHETKPNTAF